MIHVSNIASLLRLQAASLSAVVAGLALVSAASATDLNFNVANGNFTTTSNWVDANTYAPAAAAPAFGDNAFVRNGGTVTINSDVGATDIRIGHGNPSRLLTTTQTHSSIRMISSCGEKALRH